MLCVHVFDCPPLALRAQLPSLKRLDLELQLPRELLGSELRELVANCRPPPLPRGLTALSLVAGPMHGLLRHLRLPPGLQAGCD